MDSRPTATPGGPYARGDAEAASCRTPMAPTPRRWHKREEMPHKRLPPERQGSSGRLFNVSRCIVKDFPVAKRLFENQLFATHDVEALPRMLDTATGEVVDEF